jgi:hypothetical protein
MTDTFKASYAVLQKHAKTLRQQTEPNIDDLLTWKSQWQRTRSARPALMR